MTKQNTKQDYQKGLDDMKAHHMASLGALHESGKKFHSGISELMQHHQEHAANLFDSSMDALKSIFAAKTPQEAMAIQKDWAQTSMQMCMDHGKHVTKKSTVLLKEVSAPAKELIKKTTETLKKK